MLKVDRVRWREGRWLWLVLAALLFARLTGGKLPYLLLYTVSLTGLLAWLWSRQGLRQLSISQDVRPSRLTAGEPFQLRLRLYNEGLWPITWLKVAETTTVPGNGGGVRLLSLAPLQVALLERELVAQRRGLYAVGGLTLQSGDPFGLCEVMGRMPQRRTLLVQPRLIRIDSLGLPWRQPYGSRHTRHTLFEDLTAPAPHRPFQPGDSLRRVHWKATARHGELYTREFEPSVTTETHVFLDLYRHSYDAWPDGDERAAELAVSVVEYCFRHNLHASLTTYAQTRFHLAARRGHDQLPQVLELLALAQPEGKLTPADALQVEQNMLLRAGVLIVITPNTSTDLARALLQLKRRTRPILLLSLQPEPTITPWHQALQANGITVHVVDGPAGLSTVTKALPRLEAGS